MRGIFLTTALLLQPTVADAANFAVACVGTSYAENNLTGTATQSTDPLPKQIYIIDGDGKTVQRALEPRQQLDDICPSSKAHPSVDISPGLIRVTGAPDFSQNSIECSLELDRQTGKGLFTLKMNFPGNRYNRLRWEMTCEKTSVPAFNTRKNKF